MEKNRKIAIHAYKYNGWLYRAWEFPTIIDENEEYICLYSKGARVITADKKKDNVFHHSKILVPTIWYLYKKKWFNIIVAIKNKRPELYVNIASPLIFEEDTIKYIDFDLDFKISGFNVEYIKKLDEHEYDENKMKYNYPDEIKNKIMIAEKEIVDMFNNKKIKELINNDLLYWKKHG